MKSTEFLRLSLISSWAIKQSIKCGTKGRTHLQSLCLNQSSIHIVPNVHMLEAWNRGVIELRRCLFSSIWGFAPGFEVCTSWERVGTTPAVMDDVQGMGMTFQSTCSHNWSPIGASVLHHWPITCACICLSKLHKSASGRNGNGPS